MIVETQTVLVLILHRKNLKIKVCDYFFFNVFVIIVMLQELMHHVALYIAVGRGAQIASEVSFE